MTINARTAMPSRPQPRSMLLLRRAADAAGYAVAGSPEFEAPPLRSPVARVHAPALVLASVACLVGVAFAVY